MPPHKHIISTTWKWPGPSPSSIVAGNALETPSQLRKTRDTVSLTTFTTNTVPREPTSSVDIPSGTSISTLGLYHTPRSPCRHIASIRARRARWDPTPILSNDAYIPSSTPEAEYTNRMGVLATLDYNYTYLPVGYKILLWIFFTIGLARVLCWGLRRKTSKWKGRKKVNRETEKEVRNYDSVPLEVGKPGADDCALQSSCKQIADPGAAGGDLTSRKITRRGKVARDDSRGNPTFVQDDRTTSGRGIASAFEAMSAYDPSGMPRRTTQRFAAPPRRTCSSPYLRSYEGAESGHERSNAADTGFPSLDRPNASFSSLRDVEAQIPDMVGDTSSLRYLDPMTERSPCKSGLQNIYRARWGEVVDGAVTGIVDKVTRWAEDTNDDLILPITNGA